MMKLAKEVIEEVKTLKKNVSGLLVEAKGEGIEFDEEDLRILTNLTVMKMTVILGEYLGLDYPTVMGSMDEILGDELNGEENNNKTKQDTMSKMS